MNSPTSDGDPVFVEVPAPSDEALQALLHKIIARLMKLLTRCNVLVEEDEGSVYMAYGSADSDDVRTLRPPQAAPCTYRIAFGPRAGQKVFPVQGAMPRDAAFIQALCADVQGFSLRAAARCAADGRQTLEQLCRYITRPAQANELVQIICAGQVMLINQTEDALGRRHHAYRDVAVGALAAAGGVGATATAIAAHANDCFKAFHRGRAVSGLGRYGELSIATRWRQSVIGTGRRKAVAQGGPVM